jgi:hypothetical protein
VPKVLVCGYNPYGYLQAIARGFAENLDRERCAMPICERPVWWVDELQTMAATHKAICALATTRRNLYVEQSEDRRLSAWAPPFSTE